MKKCIADYVKTIPDFPEPGILFRDVTSVVEDPEGFRLAVDALDALLEDVEFDMIAGVESRGFIFGAPLAYKRGKGLALVRKKGKLPRETVSREYTLEYGTAAVELHKDTIKPGQRVVLVDDLIATGGSVEAAVRLVEQLGGEIVKIIFLMELEDLGGRRRLPDYEVESVIKYSGK